jgi:hypothetical protein
MPMIAPPLRVTLVDLARSFVSFKIQQFSVACCLPVEIYLLFFKCIHGAMYGHRKGLAEENPLKHGSHKKRDANDC